MNFLWMSSFFLDHLHFRGCLHFLRLSSSFEVVLHSFQIWGCSHLEIVFISWGHLHFWCQLNTKPNLPYWTYQTKPTKPNLPNQTKSTKPSLPNQTYQTKLTKLNPPDQMYKPNLLNQAFQTKQNLTYKTYQANLQK